MTAPILPSDALLGVPPEARPTKTEDAAQQFESLLIHQLMRSAWDSAPGGLGGEEEDSEGSLMRDLACQQFAQMLAKHGGIGLTRLLVKGLAADQPSLPRTEPNGR